MQADPAPSREVLAAFAEAGIPSAMPGGQRTVWRVNDTVFKPCDASVPAIEWQGRVLGGLVADVRTAPPLRARDGRWVVDGWTAWRYEPGAREPAAWIEVAAAGRALHRALAGVPEPGWLSTRRDPCARADRVAWSDELPSAAPGAPLLAELLDCRRALDPAVHRSQVVHLDLSGNVLFAPHALPLVLDLSPGWRPTPYASAIVAADAILWEDADVGLVDRIARGETAAARRDFAQFFLRAVIFRLLAARFARPAILAGALRSEFESAAAEAIRRCA